MSNIELGIVSLIIGIGIHYACIWGVAYENRWTKTEQLGQVYKRHKVYGKKRDDLDERIQKEIDHHSALPGFWDILPFAVFRWIKYFILAVPVFLRNVMQMVREQREENKKKDEMEKLLVKQKQLEKKTKKPKTERSNFVCAANIPSDSLIELGENLFDLDSSSSKKDSDSSDEEEQREWHNDEISLLVTTINRISSGTPNRWGKIAKKLGRSEKDVLCKSKQLQQLAIQTSKKHELRMKKAAEAANDNSTFISGFEVNEENAVCGDDADEESMAFYSKKRAARATNTVPEPTVDYEAAPAEEEEDEDGFVKLGVADEHQSRKKQRQNKQEGGSKSEAAAADSGWSQAQQKMLEAAMKSIPKGTLERWDRIAECVEGKTKEEVIARAKHLVQMCKKSDEALYANL